MPLPVPSLDDRRFDDLVAEAEARLRAALPELTQLAPGDPVHALVDLLAWLTETILYRANLIPERQRRVLLNLLAVPLRAARPARGLVCIDGGLRGAQLAALVPEGSQLSGAGQTFTTIGEVRPTPLALVTLIKQRVDAATLADMGLSEQVLRDQHRLGPDESPEPFEPRVFAPEREPLALTTSLDGYYYLALLAPRDLAGRMDELRRALAGQTLNLALAPLADVPGELADVENLRDRVLVWELLTENPTGDGDGERDPDDLLVVPIEVLADSSGGGRRAGVVRLRLPPNPDLFQPLLEPDPLFAGVGARPPELPGTAPPARVVGWLRLHCPEEPALPLGYLGINGCEVVGQATRRDLIVGIGNGRPGQVIDLPDRDIDPDSIALEVEDGGAWAPWQRVEVLTGRPASAPVYRLDAQAGQVHFGDGQHGRRPPERRRIRIAHYRHGGGIASNLPAKSLTTVAGASRLSVRQERALGGGRDAESVAEAERRIPEFLTHRNRAVTAADFRQLATGNPLNPVARAELIPGLLPGSSLATLRRDVPGVVSLFVIPPGVPELGLTPRPTQGLLNDLFTWMVDRVVLGTELYVLSPQYIPLAVGVQVRVRDPATEQQTLAAVRQALVEYLWVLAPGGSEGSGWPFGGAVRGAELATRVGRVPGVREVGPLVLFNVAQGLWQSLGEDAVLDLADFAVPDLRGVSVVTSGTPGLPAGLGPAVPGLGGSGSTGGAGTGGDTVPRIVPAPVIPELC
ncbi:baseplate J/gp47 family protein [Thiohalocapsa sp. ML1]|jgi:hypothetical protein|uniref:baseplate J/gp47 family protein n=1 Tax=Thiohalocapsa sp. ML1 TaxID=1431688 RepID=UPI0007321BD4|nr:baseplate J/gp47 family protein [Thiohalocapsa sp. ML1]